ncbi:XVIPCD domain-containing protein [Lysobacter humi (ex Lee et al. 2017)]
MAQDYSRRQVLDIIEAEARERGIPRDDFLRFAYIETGGTFDERASRGARGAKGLFQFVPATAVAYGIAGREFDPVLNTDAAARLYLDNRRGLANAHRNDGRAYLSGKPEPDGLDMYLAHQQGLGGYKSLQAALATGRFSRDDTRSNILNNVHPDDFERVTGVSYRDAQRLSDRDLARTFVAYWDTKFDRVRIPEKGIEPVRESVSKPAPADSTMQASGKQTVSLDRAHALSIEHDDVRYEMSKKSVRGGTIDCSGWVVMLQNATMQEINSKAGREIFSRGELFSPAMDGAAMIVEKASRQSGHLLEGAQVNLSTLREGMVIGEDNGRKNWDAGRFKGIDHIVMVMRDPANGRLMASQSRSGEGVELVPLDQYLQAKQARGTRLYAADPLHEARALIERPHTEAKSERDRTTPPTSTTRVATAEHDGVLERGEKGPAVTRLQQRLADLGYRGADGRPLAADGDFGANTLAAVKAFQLDHGLEGKGMVGPKTNAALDQASKALMTDPSHPHHALYREVLEKVQAAEKAAGIASGPHSRQIAATVAVECLREGLQRIDRVEINDTRTLVRAVQAGPGRDEAGLGRTDAISVPQAAHQSIAESSQQIHQVAVNRQAQEQDARQQQQQQARPVPAM